MTERRVVEDLEANLAENLRRLRDARGFSQNELAKQLQSWGLTHVRQTTVSRWEKGEQSVRVAEALGLLAVFEVDLESLLSPDEGDSLAGVIRIRYGQMMAYRNQAMGHLAEMLRERAWLAGVVPQAVAAGRGEDTIVSNAKWFVEMPDDKVWGDLREGAEAMLRRPADG